MSHPAAFGRVVTNRQRGRNPMKTTTRGSLAVVAAAVAAALVAWAVIRLVGVELTLKDGASSAGSRVDAVDVLLTSLVAGLAAWGVYALLAHWRRARWWPFIGSTALAVSITGPSYLADGTSAVA
jgi:hypothetical protein